MKLDKKLSQGKVSVVVGTQKDDFDYMVSSKDIPRNEKDLETKIELKEELKVELGITTEKKQESKASRGKSLDGFIYESLSKGSHKRLY